MLKIDIVEYERLWPVAFPVALFIHERIARVCTRLRNCDVWVRVLKAGQREGPRHVDSEPEGLTV